MNVIIYIGTCIKKVNEINTIYLKYALEVERVSSITQAAQNLYMAQPNLSKVIKELEKEVGFSIFKRTSSGVMATEEGTQFLYHAKQIVEQLDAVERIGTDSGNDRLHYKISIPRGSYIVDGFTSFISSLKIDRGMEITINETNAMGTIVNVANRSYNIGIIRYPITDEEIYLKNLKNNHLLMETIWEFEYVLVMSKNNPLASKQDISKDDLKDLIEITHGDIELPYDNICCDNSKKHNRNIIYVYERGSQFDLLSNVTSTYMWVSPIPIKVLKKNNLVQKTCVEKTEKYKDVLIYREDYHMKELDKLFQKKLYESKVDVSSRCY